jgi:hypothetical protein
MVANSRKQMFAENFDSNVTSLVWIEHDDIIKALA